MPNIQTITPPLTSAFQVDGNGKIKKDNQEM